MAASSAAKSVFEAAKAGNIEQVRELCQNRSGEELEQLVNVRTEGDGSTPLIISALHGHTKVVRYLVEKYCADVELKGSAQILSHPVVLIKEGSPLYFAAAEGHQEIVEFLVQNSAEVDSRTDSLSTPLRIACIHGHYKVVKYLVENGSDVNQTNVDQHTPLHVAAMWNRVDIVKYLLESGARITSDRIGCTPLNSAADNGSVEVVKTLISCRDVDVNQQNSKGFSPLLSATNENYTSIVRLLLLKGAKQTPDINGLTPLLIAAYLGRLELVKLLLQSGGGDHINAAGSAPAQFRNLTALQAAAAEAYEEIVLYILNGSGCYLSRDERVEALELLGAAFQSRQSNKNTRKATNYWRKALLIREKNPNIILNKPNPASILFRCRGEREVETVAQLNSIRHSDEKMSIQAALIYDRIVGPASQPKRFHRQSLVALWNAGSHVENYGAHYTGSIRIFQHVLRLNIEHCDVFHEVLPENFHQFTGKLNYALKKDENRIPKQVKFEHILQVQTQLLEVLKKQKDVLDDQGQMSSYKAAYQENIRQNHIYMVISLVQLISLTCGMLSDVTLSDEELFRSFMKEVMKLRLTGPFNHTLLEMVSDEVTSLMQYKDGERWPIVKFPCILTISLLESLGVNVK